MAAACRPANTPWSRGDQHLGERIGTTSRVHGHDVHLRLSDRTYAAVQAFAEETGLALNGCVRLLVERGIAASNGAPPATDVDALADQVRTLGQAVLASLICVEETRLYQVSVFGHHRGRERFTEEAATAARQRLAEVEVATQLEVL